MPLHRISQNLIGATICAEENAMSAASTPLYNALPQRSPGHTLTIYLKEAKYESGGTIN